MDKVVKRSQCLLNGRVWVRPMYLVQIYVVRAKPLQAVFHLSGYVLTGISGVVRAVGHAAGNLCRYYCPLPLPLQRVTYELLGYTRAVAIRRINHVDAHVQGVVDDRLRVALVQPATEIVGPQSDNGHLQARPAQLPVFHRTVPFDLLLEYGFRQTQALLPAYRSPLRFVWRRARSLFPMPCPGLLLGNAVWRGLRTFALPRRPV